jgi:LDH2 family malate/lactate/ureidoglycolate dehydrogenase
MGKKGVLEMAIISHEYLKRAVFHICKAAGSPEEEAHTVARHLVKANLVGHDSHGIIHLPSYIESIKKGHIVPGAHFEVVRETPTTARINGHWGFGFVVTEKAMRMAIQKARAHHVAALTVFYQSHIGRLGAYSMMAAQEGMIGLITADSGAGPKLVAPFGGRERRLGTNPLSIAVPSNLEGPVVLDMATSAVAGGKIEMARVRNEQVNLGWIIDREGNPTRDPNNFDSGGSILPFGGEQGHKGYALSFMVEVLSNILTGMGFGIGRKEWEGRHGLEYRHNDACFISVFDVDAFYPLEDFKREVTGLTESVKSSPAAKGFQEVLYPGEIEWLTEQRRRKEGIFIEDKTWEGIESLVKEYGLENLLGKP